MTALGFFGIVLFTALIRLIFTDSAFMNKTETVIAGGFFISVILFTFGITIWLWKVMP